MSTSDTTIVIKGGSLYGTGNNQFGQLTRATPSPYNITSLTNFDMPTTIPVDVKPKYIACGVNHTVVLMTDGTLYGTGNNQFGQLTGSTTPKISLTKIDMPTMPVDVKPKYIACGKDHTVVLMTDGTLYGTGYNLYGQLTRATPSPYKITSLTNFDMPTTIPVDVKPKYIACGVNHTVVLMTDGTLYGTGNNQFGQLTGSTTPKISLTNFDMPTTIPVDVKPKYIACGVNHTVVLMTDGSLYGTGYNGYGQLTGSTTPKISLTKIDMPTTNPVDVKPKYIACGVNHTVVLMTDGSLYGTGRNQLGQLTRTGNKSSLTSISDGVSYIADMMDYPDIHNYTVYFMKSF